MLSSRSSITPNACLSGVLLVVTCICLHHEDLPGFTVLLMLQSTVQMRKRKRTKTSQFRGVTRAGAKWRAAIRMNNIKRELGIFDTEAEAARYSHCWRSTRQS